MVTKVGTNGRDILTGNAGPDKLFGLSGNDDLFGLNGDDILRGGAGNDLVVGGNGRDTLYGDAGNDTLKGQGGTDELLGGAGNDVLMPGAGGLDAMDGGVGFDFISFADLAVACTVDLINGASQGGGAGIQTLFSVEGAIGSSVGDMLAIKAGQKAFGGGGADTISTAGGGIMRGDAGIDTLECDTTLAFDDVVWLQRGRGADFVENFVVGDDKILVVGSEFGIGALLNGDEFFNNASGHAPTGPRPQFIIDQITRQLWFDANGTLAGGDILMATFNTYPVNGIAMANFLVI